MPIEFDCTECDRHLRVKDEMAGKRVKCPECQEVLKVPDAEAPEERPAERIRTGKPAPKKAAPARSRDEDDRPKRKARRDEDEEEEEERPKRRAKGRDDDDEEDERPRRRGREEDDEEDEDDRPSRRKKKAKKDGSSMTLVLGIGGGVLGLALLGVGLWLFLSSGGKGGIAGGDKDKDKDKGKPGGDPPAAVASDFVPGDAEAFFSMRVAELWKNEQVRKGAEAALKAQGFDGDGATWMKQNLGLGPTEIERLTWVFRDAKNQDGWLVIETSADIDQAKIKGKFARPSEQTVEGRKYTSGFLAGAGKATGIHFASARLAVWGPDLSVRTALTTVARGRAKGALDDGLPLLKAPHPMAASFKMPPDLAEELRGQPQFAAAAAIVSGTATLDMSAAEVVLEANFKFPDDAKASVAKKAADGGLALGKLLVPTLVPDAKAAADLGKVMDAVKVEQRGSAVVVKASMDARPGAYPGLDALFTQPPTAREEGPADQAASEANLKELALALVNYQAANGHYPNDIVDGTGKPLLSWRVALLPYLEQEALYKEFRLNEPWNSAHNQRLAGRMPKVFTNRLKNLPNTTGYVRFTGAGTPFPDAKAKPKIVELVDGTSNTIAVVDSTRQQNWSEPGDIRLSPTGDVRSNLRTVNGGHLVALFDGATRKLKTTISAATLRNAITHQDAIPLGSDW
ncbi:MAG: DUF1559 domain-containing protein [Gemmataceae bacterium]|nr:DUF1559 domain-containing protein [Gemmataceae bacterium]